MLRRPDIIDPMSRAGALQTFWHEAEPEDFDLVASDPNLYSLVNGTGIDDEDPLLGPDLNDEDLLPVQRAEAPWDTLAEAAGVDNAAARAAFAKQIRKRSLQAQQQTIFLLRETRANLKAYRDQVVAAVSPVSEWDAHRLAQVRERLAELDTAYARAITGGFQDRALEASALSIAGVTDPLQAIGLQVDHLPSAIDPRLVAFTREYYPGLIQDVTGPVRSEVGKLLAQQVLGGAGAGDVIKRIGDLVGPLTRTSSGGGTLIQSAESRARRTMITEMNRIYDVSAADRIDTLAAHNPGIGSRWIHRPEASNAPRASHAVMNGTVIYPGKGERFTLPNGERCRCPHDPDLSAKESIGCHCTLVVVYNATEGRAAARDSAVTQGDGSTIPSAGIAPSAPRPGTASELRAPGRRR